uniref:Uncharacterized protein n=1 Tax=Streptomyces sp. 44030 TaxID=364102 RepID=Q2LEX7_9ACTN|nr:hypothetical protein [Streptomyces sp. 44030]ABC67338.1 hypothetical protein pRL1.9 [Streptomyces sp. 44030]
MDQILAAHEGEVALDLPVHIQQVNDLLHVLLPAALPGDETYLTDDELLLDAKLALWEHQMRGGNVVGSSELTIPWITAEVAA